MTNRNVRGFGSVNNITTRRIIRLGMSVDRPSTARDRRRLSGIPDDGLYVISVAARLLEMHPQTLRKYERAGLVRPSRTVGGGHHTIEADKASCRGSGLEYSGCRTSFGDV